VTDVPLIRLPTLAGRQVESWHALIDLVPSLGTNWLLVGGQMVYLHEVERRSGDLRPTDDIDVVIDLRVDLNGLTRINVALVAAGFAQDLPSPDGVAHRYRRQGAVIDVLAPDHVGKRATLRLGIGRTIEAPGTTQAFGRSSVVRVELSDQAAALIRRPTLVGALLGKAAAVIEIVSQTTAERAHLRDVDALARLLGVSDREDARLSKKERATLTRLVDQPELTRLAVANLIILSRGGDSHLRPTSG
jgi:hypothetical protein